MYGRVDAKVDRTSSTMGIEASIRVDDIIVGDPSEWLVLSVLGEKRICSSFDNCMVSFHECLFTRIGL